MAELWGHQLGERRESWMVELGDWKGGLWEELKAWLWVREKGR
jgi:hypothetical protein